MDLRLTVEQLKRVIDLLISDSAQNKENESFNNEIWKKLYLDMEDQVENDKEKF